ncbi:MAG: hypothetical protein RMJ13_00390 [Elusimicrobiota bacterium]|nr:hypothetical protein [Elusimicrobiota bacterium]
MKKTKFLLLFSLVFTTNLCFCQVRRETVQPSGTDEEKLTDEKMLSMLDTALRNLPEKIKLIPTNIRRVAFYSLRADRTQVSQVLLRQIQGKIESSFTSASEHVSLVYSPEVKPIKIVAKDDTLTFTSGFQSTEEIKSLAQKLRLDGLLEGEIYYTPQTVYLNLRIFDTETMSIVWSCELNNIVPTPPPPAKPKLFWYDLGFGFSSIPVELLSPAEATKVASYYNADLRILMKTLFEEKIKFSLSAGTLFLYEGVYSSTKTIVSSSRRGTGPNSFFVRGGIKLSLIQRESIIPGIGKKDLLSVEFSFGNIFAAGKEMVNIPCYSVKFESDITKEITVSAGVNYLPPTKLPEVNFRAGGIGYEISVIRFILNP